MGKVVSERQELRSYGVKELSQMLCCRAAMALLTRQLVDLSTAYRTKELSQMLCCRVAMTLLSYQLTLWLTCQLVNSSTNKLVNS